LGRADQPLAKRLFLGGFKDFICGNLLYPANWKWTTWGHL